MNKRIQRALILSALRAIRLVIEVVPMNDELRETLLGVKSIIRDLIDVLVAE